MSQLELEALHQEMLSCRACELRGGCSRVVPGEGAADALVVFFGEGPGEDEDTEGRPFIGRSGQFLREQLRLNEIDTEKSYISNIVRCRPPENRPPTMTEMEACWPWMEKTLHIIKPRIIVTLGRSPLVALSQKLGFFNKVGQNKITKLAGVPIYLADRNAYVFPLLHPAYACRKNDARASFSGGVKYLKLAVPGWLKRETQ